METATALRARAGRAAGDELSGYPEILRELLLERGLSTRAAAERFLHPDFERDTHDPFLLLGMETAVERVLHAVERGERIAIYSDYDMDGIPGAVVLADFFRLIGYRNLVHYVPSRNSEGYGVNAAAVEQLADGGVSLIITVDCGIRAAEAVAHARARGVDTIVTDHHVPGEVLPDATAILNPLLPGDRYPNKHLCGAGVAFKLLSGLVARSEQVPERAERWSLDMVAAATIADMVPLLGENRALVHFGLTVLRKSRRPGLRALCRSARIELPYVREDDVMFSIAPRVNAASRMGEAGSALGLLNATTDAEATRHAQHLERLNRERKGAVAAMVRHITETVSSYETMPIVLVVGDPRWQPGLLGLAATRAVEAYGRPVCVWGRGDGVEVKGSCRSDGSVNVVSLLESARDVLTEYGGHERSGGFSVKTEHVHALREALNRYDGSRETPQASAVTHLELPIEAVTWETYSQLDSLAPFGVGNEKPTFLFRDVPVSGIRRFGAGSVHLELTLEHPESGTVRAIAFFASDELAARVREGERANLAAHLEQSFFGRNPELRLRIADIL